MSAPFVTPPLAFAPREAPGPRPLVYCVEERASGLFVLIGGDIDENASFADLVQRLDGRVGFDLSRIRRINSCGVREWVNLGRELARLPIAVEYHACSPAVVAQLNTISNFRGEARVASFLAPYVCEPCDREEQRLVEVAADPAATALPALACGSCGGPLVFDDLEERYLSFLREL